MKRLVFLACLALSAQTYAGQIDINFDDLSGAGAVPGNYEGLTWTGTWQYYGAPQPPYDPSSGANRAFEYGPSYINFGQAVTFEGSWFAGYGAPYSAPYWVAYDKNGNPIPGDSSLPDGTGTTYGNFVNLDWTGVYSVGLFSVTSESQYNFFIVDDIKYSTGGSNVPDATSSGLMLSMGVAGLGFLRRKLA